MKTSCLKYIVIALWVGVFCAETQALSEKSKAILKSGTLGTLSTAAAFGASWFVKQQIQNAYNEKDAFFRACNRDQQNVINDQQKIILATSYNTIATGLLAGYIAARSAYNAFRYFKHIKILKNQRAVA